MKIRAAAKLDFRIGKMELTTLQCKERQYYRRVPNGEKGQMLAHAVGERRGGADAVNYAAAIHVLAGVIDGGQLRMNGISTAVRETQLVEVDCHAGALVQQAQAH